MTSPPEPDPLTPPSTNGAASDVVRLNAHRAETDESAEGLEAVALPVDNHGVSPQVLAPRQSWWRSFFGALRRDALLREVVTAAVVGVLLLGAAAWFDARNAQRAEVLENIRFVRQAAMADAKVLPFQGLNLMGAQLAGLPLGCDVEIDSGQTEAERDARLLTCAEFTGANLTGADLTGADLTGADLGEANLGGANLYFAKLPGTDLVQANLGGANLGGANLTRADLTRADLSEANLAGTELVQANLSEASLNRADLTRADLSEANLSQANLSQANLTSADLTNVRYDDLTEWPEGFQPPPSTF